jgi:cell division septation protein DedD
VMEKEFAARLAAAKPEASPEASTGTAPSDDGVGETDSEAQTAVVDDVVMKPRGALLLTVAHTTASRNVPEAEESEASDPADAAEDDADPAEGFSLQVGAFRSEENALRLRDDLKARGYSVYLVRSVDERGSEWHTVRMGHYRDKAEASSEAAVFASETQIAAVVRGSGE